jgi:hypothetical protein
MQPADVPDTQAADSSQRLLTFRATRALTLGILAMGAAAWLVTVPGVLVGLACGAAPALLTPRFRLLRIPIFATLAAAVVGALAGSLLLGHGTAAMRLLGGLVASLAVGPWLVVLGFTRWVRARHSEQRAV